MQQLPVRRSIDAEFAAIVAELKGSVSAKAQPFEEPIPETDIEAPDEAPKETEVKPEKPEKSNA